MTAPVPPSLKRFGDELDRAAHSELSAASEPLRAPFRRRGARVVAGSTLGLAGVGAAVVFALGGSAAPPAFAITTNSDGSLTVNLDNPGGVIGVNRRLAAMGAGEHIWIQMGQGAPSVTGAVSCVVSPADASVPGPAVTVTVGPGDTNSETIAAGNTGAGTWHVAACWRFSGTDTASVPTSGNSGNSGTPTTG